MFKTNNTIRYIDSGEELIVTEVHDSHIVVITTDGNEEYFFINEEEYDSYELVR